MWRAEVPMKGPAPVAFKALRATKRGPPIGYFLAVGVTCIYLCAPANANDVNSWSILFAPMIAQSHGLVDLKDSEHRIVSLFGNVPSALFF